MFIDIADLEVLEEAPLPAFSYGHLSPSDTYPRRVDSIATLGWGTPRRRLGGRACDEAPSNPRYSVSMYALAASRHMHDYGTTREQPSTPAGAVSRTTTLACTDSSLSSRPCVSSAGNAATAKRRALTSPSSTETGTSSRARLPPSSAPRSRSEEYDSRHRVDTLRED